MINSYQELRERQQKEFNALPIKFAFSSEQFEQILKEFGCESSDLYNLGYGGFYKKSDSELIRDTMHRHNGEMDKAMEDFDFLVSAFEYELANHEFCITFDPTDTFEALGFKKGAEKSEVVMMAYEQGKKQYLHSVWPEDYPL